MRNGVSTLQPRLPMSRADKCLLSSCAVLLSHHHPQHLQDLIKLVIPDTNALEEEEEDFFFTHDDIKPSAVAM